ncbi:hypothetical protein Aspvir_000561 [Aspergillus viridinutans]|uniref:Protein kinase domain-containing protein n=1 Tax=Aspergillus viridinutans TaxID=75553 RepID=A0A9P3BL36_ASPVI|nr:uncharacterized protein Aspvir_000561 [Aspergillus viridinutans]GIJ98444.1 hypothetical protein Aspvir_000561 [Aspergillus viridinutans]
MGLQSILFGGEDGVAQQWVNCHRLIKGSHTKALYEVTWDGEPAVAKCWSNARLQGYIHEASTYERLYQLRPEGFEFFATLQSHGKIVCSSLFPKGHIMIIKKVKGEPLDRQWDLLSTDHKQHIRSTIRRAVEALRSIGYLSLDSGKHNVLYSPETRTVTMLDFELMQACDESTMSPDRPEMYAIFGHPVPWGPFLFLIVSAFSNSDPPGSATKAAFNAKVTEQGNALWVALKRRALNRTTAIKELMEVLGPLVEDMRSRVHGKLEQERSCESHRREETEETEDHRQGPYRAG